MIRSVYNPVTKRLEIVKGPDPTPQGIGAPGLVGTATQVNGAQIQAPDGKWYDPSGLSGANNPAAKAGGTTAAVTLPELAVQPTPAAPATNAGGGMMRKPLAQHYAELEQARGLPQGFLAQTRAVESSNGRNTQNKNSSAGGDFQFIDSTAKAMGLRNRFDPYESATAAADLAAKNAAAFKARTGANPTGQDLYGMHQQGSGGYLGLLAGKAPGGAAQSLNGGAGMSPSGFLAKIHGIYNGAKVDPTTLGLPADAVAGDPNAQRGPTVAAAQRSASGTPLVTDPKVIQPDPSTQTYTGGLIGLAKGDDYSGQGSAKSTFDKVGDTVKSDAFGGAIKGLTAALATPQQTQPDRPIVVNPDNVNVPQLQFMELLKKRRAAMGGGLM